MPWGQVPPEVKPSMDISPGRNCYVFSHEQSSPNPAQSKAEALLLPCQSLPSSLSTNTHISVGSPLFVLSKTSHICLASAGLHQDYWLSLKLNSVGNVCTNCSMSTSVGVMPNEESRGWCWAAESSNLFQLTAGSWRGHLFMASVYSSFVDLTKMLLAKSNSYWGRVKGKSGFFVAVVCLGFVCREMLFWKQLQEVEWYL